MEMLGCDYQGLRNVEPRHHGAGNVSFPDDWTLAQRVEWRRQHFIPGASWTLKVEPPETIREWKIKGMHFARPPHAHGYWPAPPPLAEPGLVLRSTEVYDDMVHIVEKWDVSVPGCPFGVMFEVRNDRPVRTVTRRQEFSRAEAEARGFVAPSMRGSFNFGKAGPEEEHMG